MSRGRLPPAPAATARRPPRERAPGTPRPSRRAPLSQGRGCARLAQARGRRAATGSPPMAERATDLGRMRSGWSGPAERGQCRPTWKVLAPWAGRHSKSPSPAQDCQSVTADGRGTVRGPRAKGTPTWGSGWFEAWHLTRAITSFLVRCQPGCLRAAEPRAVTSTGRRGSLNGRPPRPVVRGTRLGGRPIRSRSFGRDHDQLALHAARVMQQAEVRDLAVDVPDRQREGWLAGIRQEPGVDQGGLVQWRLGDG